MKEKDQIIAPYKGQFGNLSEKTLDQLSDTQCRMDELASKHDEVEEILKQVISEKEESEKEMSDELDETRKKLEKIHEEMNHMLKLIGISTLARWRSLTASLISM